MRAEAEREGGREGGWEGDPGDTFFSTRAGGSTRLYSPACRKPRNKSAPPWLGPRTPRAADAERFAGEPPRDETTALNAIPPRLTGDGCQEGCAVRNDPGCARLRETAHPNLQRASHRRDDRANTSVNTSAVAAAAAAAGGDGGGASPNGVAVCVPASTCVSVPRHSHGRSRLARVPGGCRALFSRLLSRPTRMPSFAIGPRPRRYIAPLMARIDEIGPGSRSTCARARDATVPRSGVGRARSGIF